MNAIEVNADSITQIALVGAFAALLQTYSPQQRNKLELIDSVVNDHGFREYHAFCLEDEYQMGDLRISFSLYSNKKTNGDKDEYQPMMVEFIHNDTGIENEALFLTHWAETLDQIKADLFKNSFPDVEL